MIINHSQEINSLILKISAIYKLSVLVQELIGNPIEISGTQNISERTVSQMIEETKEEYFKDFTPSWFKKNAVPASIFAAEFAPDFLKHCTSLNDGDFIVRNIMKECVYLNTTEMKNDPYMKNIQIPSVSKGKYRLGYETLKKNDLFILDNVYAKDPFSKINLPVLACMDKDYRFPYIEENGNVWMSVAPNEIRTMEKDISDAHGKVLTLGLGLGYFPYVVSQKDDVSEITIVEINENIIDLFVTYLLPQIPNKEKIKIINENALTYMSRLEDGTFDTCFADIWISANDIDTYLKLKMICSGFEKTKITYWIEQRFTSLLYGLLAKEVISQYLPGLNDHCDTLPIPYESFAETFIKEAYQDTVFTSAAELSNIFSVQSLNDLMSHYSRKKDFGKEFF